MSLCTAVLVHSPLVGPLTWLDTAAELSRSGIATVVPDLRGASDQMRITDAVTAAVAGAQEPIILIGHSGAGRHLPTLADAMTGVALLVYVDAALPYPGRSWFDDAPAELGANLRGMADADGILPRWPEWFGPEAIARLLPDPAQRQRFVDDVPRLPLSYFAEPAPLAAWAGPQVYLQLSEAYNAEADRMRQAEVPVITRSSHHLAMLTEPAMVAQALLTCLAT